MAQLRQTFIVLSVQFILQNVVGYEITVAGYVPDMVYGNSAHDGFGSLYFISNTTILKYEITTEDVTPVGNFVEPRETGYLVSDGRQTFYDFQTSTKLNGSIYTFTVFNSEPVKIGILPNSFGFILSAVSDPVSGDIFVFHTGAEENVVKIHRYNTTSREGHDVGTILTNSISASLIGDAIYCFGYYQAMSGSFPTLTKFLPATNQILGMRGVDELGGGVIQGTAAGNFFYFIGDTIWLRSGPASRVKFGRYSVLDDSYESLEITNWNGTFTNHLNPVYVDLLHRIYMIGIYEHPDKYQVQYIEL